MKLLGKLSFSRRWEWLWGGAVFLISYLVYLLTLYPNVASEDSGEFTTAVATLGIAHPPGYPLYTVLGKIFSLIVPFGNMAWRVNVFSAFFAAAAIALLYYFLKLLTRHDLFSFLGAMIFASSPFFWSQAIRAEVYSLNTFLLLLLLTIVFSWYRENSNILAMQNLAASKKEKRQDQGIENKALLYWLCFFYGLSLGNHPLMLMAGPPLLVFVLGLKPKLWKDGRFLLKGLGFFCLGLSIYLYLPLRASMHPDFNWGDPSTWQNFWDHVTRKMYTARGVDSSSHLYSGSKENPEPSTIGSGIGDFFIYHVWSMAFFTGKHFIANFLGILGVFIPTGFFWLYKKFQKFCWFFLGLIFFYSFVMAKMLGLGYTNQLPVEYFKQQPFFIPILLLLFCVALCGIFYFFEKATNNLAVKPSLLQNQPPEKRIFKGVIFILLGCTAFTGFIWHFHQNDQSKNYLAYDLAKAMLNELPTQAVLLISNGDNTLFPVFYLNIVEGFRKDLVIYIPSPIHVYRFFESYEKMVQDHPGKRFFTDFPFEAYVEKTYDYLGPVSEIVDKPDIVQRREVLRRLENLQIRGIAANNLDHFNTYLKARFLFDKGLAYDDVDELKQQDLFKQALLTAPDSKNIFTQLVGNYYVRKGKFSEGLPYLEQAYVYLPQDYSLNFQLLIAYIVTDQPQKTLPHLKILAQNHQDQFLHDYGILQQQLPQFSQQFAAFEKYFKK